MKSLPRRLRGTATSAPSKPERRLPVNRTATLKRSAGLTAVAWLAVIAFFTLGPGDPGEKAAPISCLRCGSFWLTDMIANVLLFVPLGVAGAISDLRPHRILLVGASLSVGIEIWQFLGVAGRDATLVDVVTNSVGALLGALCAPTIESSLTPDRLRARSLLTTAAVVVAGMSLLLAPLLGPTQPKGSLYLQIQPERDTFSSVHSVSDVVLNGQRLRIDGPIPVSSDPRAAFRRGHISLSAAVQTALADRRREVLARVTPPLEATLTELGVTAEHWYGTVGLRGEDFGLRGFWLAVRRDRQHDSAVRVAVSRSEAQFQLIATSEMESRMRSRSFALSVLEVWIPFMPFRTVVEGSLLPMSVALAVVVPAILGWWAGLARSGRHEAPALIALLLAALGPTLTAGLAAPPAWAWVLALTSWFSSRLGGRRQSRRVPERVATSPEPAPAQTIP